VGTAAAGAEPVAVEDGVPVGEPDAVDAPELELGLSPLGAALPAALEELGAAAGESSSLLPQLLTASKITASLAIGARFMVGLWRWETAQLCATRSGAHAGAGRSWWERKAAGAFTPTP
jgi:hypothetical protein